MALDLKTFKPADEKELLAGILTELAAVLGESLNKFKKEMLVHVKSVVGKAWNTQEGLRKGTISQADADIALHTQELALSGVLLYAEFMAYVLAQQVLDVIFKVITAAIENITNVKLKF